MSTIAMPPPNTEILSRRGDIIADLERALPGGRVITEPSETRVYECDALASYRCQPLAVVPFRLAITGIARELAAFSMRARCWPVS